MRNLLEYPITEEELIRELTWLKEEEINSGRVGGNIGFILSRLIELIVGGEITEKDFRIR